jgi:hypothetical protein
MFGIFGDRKTKLQKKYQSLLEESHRLSHTDRKKSDAKAAEANEILKQIESLESSEK